MVWESSIWVEKLTATDICTERCEDVICKESSSTISSIYNDFHIAQISTYSRADHRAEVSGVHLHQIYAFGIVFERKYVGTCRIFENFRDVCLVQSAFSGEELESISVKWQVASRDHYCSIELIVWHNCRHIHRRCGSEPSIANLDTKICHARHERIC